MMHSPSSETRSARLRRFLLAALLTLPALSAAGTAARALQQAQGPQPRDLDAQLPFDAAVRTGVLDNGLTFYVRQNGRPAGRVLLRLAVKAGSLDEADDQQGLAHFLEHMAFNGSEHFEPGELISYFESTGARLGPHVNAYTSFEETVYMLDLPVDRPDVVARGLTALEDVAGGLTLDPGQIDKERGVVIEEWRRGLGAQSRIRDKQIPILYHDSHYANRLPIGKPDVLRTAPPERFRAFYDTFYRPDRMAVVVVGDVEPEAMIRDIRKTLGSVRARSAQEPPARRNEVPLHAETLVSVAADPELTRSSVSVYRKRPARPETRVRDYRRAFAESLLRQIVNERFADLARRPDATILGAFARDDRLSPGVEAFTLAAGVQDGRLLDGTTTLVIEANRLRQHGVGDEELERAKKRIIAAYERAYSERDKTESASFAREYVAHYLEGEPSPGVEYEYRLMQDLLPGVTSAEVGQLARELLDDASRVVLAVSPQKEGLAVPTEAGLRDAIASAEKVAVTPWAETASTRKLMETAPAPATIVSRRERADIGVTVVTFGNGVEAWLKPTDFKNDEILFTMYAPGGLSLAAPERFPEASLSASYATLSGAGGLKALDIEKLLAGALVSASPSMSLVSHAVSGSSTPAQLETALQLLHQRVVAPGDDPEAFALLTRQLAAAVANRRQNPQALFGDKVAEVNSSNHYSAQPLTPDRVQSLDREAMVEYYRARFTNAADFTFFMVGAFDVEQALPLLARYVGGLPSTGQRSAAARDVGLRFPSEKRRERVVAGREPRSQTVISFFADPPSDPNEQERVLAAAEVLEIALRDILREDLGQTYSVSVNLNQRLPQRGGGHVSVSFGSDPANVDTMVQRVLDEIGRLRQDGPTDDLTARARETARRNYEVALRQNAYWLGRLQTTHILGQDPGIIVTRPARIEKITPAALKEAFTAYFPLDRYTVVSLVPAASGGD